MLQVSHSKKSIRVTSSFGEAWTSKRGARRLIARGMGALQPDGSILLAEEDYRFDADAPDIGGMANIQHLIRPFPIDIHLQDDRAVLKYWPDQGCGGVEV